MYRLPIFVQGLNKIAGRRRRRGDTVYAASTPTGSVWRGKIARRYLKISARKPNNDAISTATPLISVRVENFTNRQKAGKSVHGQTLYNALRDQALLLAEMCDPALAVLQRYPAASNTSG